MKIWVPVAVGGGGLAVIVAVGGVLLASQDVGALKGLVEDKVYEQTGRKLAINGEFGLTVSFSPGIRATEVTFENAPWASEAAMVAFREAEAKVALIPMLMGDVEVKRLVLTGARVELETDRSGRNNWDFVETAEEPPASGAGPSPAAPAPSAPSPDAGPEPAPAAADEEFRLPVIEEVRIEDLTLIYRDGAAATVRRVVLDEARGSFPATGAPFELALKGAVDGAAIDIEGRLGPGRRDLPVVLEGELAGATFALEGTIAEPLAARGLDLAFSIAGKTLSDLDALAGGGLPAGGPYAASGRLLGGPKAFKLEDLALAFGGSELAGTVALDLGPARPRFEASLSSPALDLDDFRGSSPAAEPSVAAEGQGAADSSTAADAPSAAGREDAGRDWVFDSKPLPIEALRAADGRAHVTVGRLKRGEIVIEDLDFTIGLNNGRLAVEPLKAGLANGAIEGRLLLDGGKAKPVLEIDAALAGADFGALTGGKAGSLAGKLDARIDVGGVGISPRAIAEDLDGRISAHLEGGRQMPEWLEYALGRDLIGALAFWQQGNPPKLHCFVAGLTFADGQGKVDPLLVDTSHATLSGTGRVDLRNETLDVTAVPRPKDASLLSIALPVKITGALADPDWGIDREAAALDVASSLAGNALLGPLGLILPLVDEGSGAAADGEDPCLAALERAKGGAPAPGANEPAAPASPAGTPLEDLLKGLEGLF